MAEQASVETITNLSRRAFLDGGGGARRIGDRAKHARARRHRAHRFFDASRLTVTARSLPASARARSQT